MNLANKTKWANVLTAFGLIILTVQALITKPPFSDNQVFVITTVLIYLGIVTTAFKQWLSPEVSSTGTKVTIWIAIGATVAGLLDLIPVLKLDPEVAQYVKLSINIIVSVINIISKQLFPSDTQQDNMDKLKFQK